MGRLVSEVSAAVLQEYDAVIIVVLFVIAQIIKIFHSNT